VSLARHTVRKTARLRGLLLAVHPDEPAISRISQLNRRMRPDWDRRVRAVFDRRPASDRPEGPLPAASRCPAFAQSADGATAFRLAALRKDRA